MVPNSGELNSADQDCPGSLSDTINPSLFNGFPAPQFRQISLGQTDNRSLFVWFPLGIPVGSSVCVASSRLGRNLEEHDDWFDALRTLAIRLDPQSHFFVTSAGTTTDPFVRHLCLRFGFSAVDLQPWTKETSLLFSQYQNKSNTLVDCPLPFRCEPGSGNLKTFPAYCIPVRSLPEDGFPVRRLLDQVTLPPKYLVDALNEKVNSALQESFQLDRDAALIRIATKCYLLSIRPKGNIHRAVLDRIADSSNLPTETTRTWIVVSKDSRRSALHRELLKAGAFGWWLYNGTPDSAGTDSNHESGSNHSSNPNPVSPGEFSPPILTIDEFPAENFLIHWTRNRTGPWPQQTEEEWLDDLIFQSDRRNHGASHALRRILATKQILASHKLTRDGQPVVCLSNRSLREIGELTVFRQHLGRWDFVPFGLAIDRQWIASQGARPVIYGESETWDSLPESDRPFFQLAQSKSGKIDWTIEQEWRWLGNLNLRHVPHQAIAVFVPTLSEARIIAPYCTWPIIVLGIERL